MTIGIPDMEYQDAHCSRAGWCVFCSDFTTPNIEHEAENNLCDVCEQPGVYGTRWAVLAGLFTVETPVLEDTFLEDLMHAMGDAP